MEGAPNRIWRSRTLIFLAAVAVGGCHHRDEGPYPTLSAPSTPSSARSASGIAYDDYARAGAEADGLIPASLRARTSYSPPQRKQIEVATRDAMRQVAAAHTKPCDFVYEPHQFGKPLPYRQSWRMIGRVLRWKIDDAVVVGDLDRATSLSLILTKFGFDVASGGPEDASLGLLMVDDARRSLVGAMPKLTVKQLHHLSQSFKAIYLARPPAEKMLEHAKTEMLSIVQAVQELYVRRDKAQLERVMGTETREAQDYLDSLHEQASSKRATFFAGFASDADDTYQRMHRALTLDFAQGHKLLSERPKGERPWKRFTRTFFSFGLPLLSAIDATEARTQMMILDAEILASIKSTHAAPRSLARFTPALTVDPFTRRQFVYRSDGADYRLYSMGEDGRDDGGDTDSTFSKPDLTIERPRG